MLWPPAPDLHHPASTTVPSLLSLSSSPSPRPLPPSGMCGTHWKQPTKRNRLVAWGMCAPVFTPQSGAGSSKHPRASSRSKSGVASPPPPPPKPPAISTCWGLCLRSAWVSVGALYWSRLHLRRCLGLTRCCRSGSGLAYQLHVVLLVLNPSLTVHESFHRLHYRLYTIHFALNTSTSCNHVLKYTV